ncbi:Mce-associated membrane protein [Actinomadura glauciflava]|nr:Mce-associated membrane protein [Actinomadura glauciflava]
MPDEKPRHPARTPLRPDDTPQRTAGALLVLALLFAVWAAWAWYSAAHDDARAYSRVRDDVLEAGEQGVQNLNTLDYRSLGPGLKTWQDSTTGDLHRQIAQGRPDFERRVAQARTITRARILDAAVAELDERSGRARMLVAVEITVTPPDGDPETRQSRLIGELTRTSGGWKLSRLGQAPAEGT